MLTLADDSGLEVDALNGAPGIYSARYCGEEGDDQKNNEKALDALKDVPEEKRTARFVCVLALCAPQSQGPKKKLDSARIVRRENRFQSQRTERLWLRSAFFLSPFGQNLW